MTETRAWADDLFGCIDAMDTEAFLGFLHDDVLFQFGNIPTTRGKTAVRVAVQGFFDSIRSVRHRLIDLWNQGDSVICRGEVAYTRHNASTLCVPFANILRLESGLIAEYLIYVDISELYRPN